MKENLFDFSNLVMSFSNYFIVFGKTTTREKKLHFKFQYLAREKKAKVLVCNLAWENNSSSLSSKLELGKSKLKFEFGT